MHQAMPSQFLVMQPQTQSIALQPRPTTMFKITIQPITAIAAVMLQMAQVASAMALLQAMVNITTVSATVLQMMQVLSSRSQHL